MDKGNRALKFDIRAEVGGKWLKVVEGTRIGPDYKAQFPAVNARLVRLSVEDASEGPAIREFGCMRR